MLKIGITGGIGSGKSVVSELFRIHDIPVYDADSQAKRLNDTSPAIREKLIAQFGTHIYTENKLNKSAFAAIIFSDAEKLQQANAIIHPHLLEDFEQWCAQRKHKSIVAMDAALLFEADFVDAFDAIIVVAAPENIRMARAMKRDHASQAAIKARMARQLPEEEKIKFADFVIENDGNHSLIKQTAAILHTLKTKKKRTG